MTKREVSGGIMMIGGGRRRRPSAEAVVKPTTSKSLSDAKANFMASVSRGVTVLMEDYGYSRERAQQTLLQEIARGSDSSIPPPADDEVFNVMSTRGLSMDDAAKALAVSRSLQRDTTELKVSLMEAVDDLTTKLSLANLFRLDRDASPSRVIANTSTVGDVVAMRIQPMERMLVAPTRHQQQLKTTIPGSSPIATDAIAPSRKTKALSNKNAKHRGTNGNAIIGRKRPAEDMNTKNAQDNKVVVTTAKDESTQTFTKRERSDSLSEVVNAKFGDTNLAGESDASPSAKITADITSAVVRSMRARSEDAETTQCPMKRPRTASRDI